MQRLRGGAPQAEREVRIRLAMPADVPVLSELEQRKEPALRAIEATLCQRLERHPLGQFVAVGADDTILAAMYTQRITSVDALRTATHESEAALHSPGAAVVQLLGVTARP